MPLTPKQKSNSSGFTYSVASCSSGFRMFSMGSRDISSACLATIPEPAPRSSKLQSRTKVPMLKAAGQYVYSKSLRAKNIRKPLR